MEKTDSSQKFSLPNLRMETESIPDEPLFQYTLMIINSFLTQSCLFKKSLLLFSILMRLSQSIDLSLCGKDLTTS